MPSRIWSIDKAPLERLIARLSGCLFLAIGGCSLGVLDDLSSGFPDGGGSSPRDGGSDGSSVAPHCTNHEPDMGESDTDCGGDTTCDRCDTGDACSKGSDCESDHCVDRMCAAASCDDHVLNQDELQIDCGGRCPDCDPCDNGKRDEGEADVDCGGSCAKYPCVTGLSCTSADDCATGSCEDQTCRPGSRGAYWPIAEWMGAMESPDELPWDVLSHLFIAHVGVSSTFRCAFWTDAGESDTADAAARRDVEALLAYRKEHEPDVKVLMSIGGPLLSYRLSAAASAAHRDDFVTSCIALMTELGADGIDVDWRFPGAFAGPASGPGSCREADGCDDSEDPQTFTRLLDAFRRQLDKSARGKLLTAVLRANTSSGGGANVPYEYGALGKPSPRLLDWASIAAFDMHGSASTVDFGAPFDETLNALTFARSRVGEGLSHDLFLGVSFSGPYWSGVAEPGPSGVGGAGTPAGSLSYRTVKNYLSSSASCEARTPETGDTRNRYVYCAGEVGQLEDLWISYDDPSVLLNKAKYTRLQSYAGVNAWYLGQDASGNDLFNEIVSGMEDQHPYGDEPQSLPSLVQAENYDSGGEGLAFVTQGGATSDLYRHDDASIEMCTDKGAGFDVPLLGGEWLEYTVTPELGGIYNVEFRVAGTTGGQLHLEVDDENHTRLTDQVTVPGTSGPQTWTTVETTSPSMQAAQQELRLLVDSGALNLNWFRFTRGQSPYLGLPVAIPGTLQMEYFDVGGRNVAWSDTSSSSYVIERVGPVEIQSNFDPTAGLHVTGVQPGEWLEYTVDVAQGGAHNLEVRATSGGTFGVHVQSEDGTNLSGPIAIPFIGEADEWLTLEGRTPLSLPAGVQTLRFVTDSAGSGRLNLNWMRLTRGQVANGGAAPSPIPGTLQAEAFDLGGADVAYEDSTLGNAFKEYRYTDVDVEVCYDTPTGFDVAQVVADEWIEFTVNVAESGNYSFEVRAASSAGNASLHLEDEEGTNLGTVAIESTGGAQMWQTFRLADVALTEGVQVLRFYFETPRASYNWFRFSGPH